MIVSFRPDVYAENHQNQGHIQTLKVHESAKAFGAEKLAATTDHRAFSNSSCTFQRRFETCVVDQTQIYVNKFTINSMEVEGA